VSKLRPRYINPETYIEKAAQWEKWHEEQSRAENEDDKTT